jgi:hypothetical protein
MPTYYYLLRRSTFLARFAISLFLLSPLLLTACGDRANNVQAVSTPATLAPTEVLIEVTVTPIPVTSTASPTPRATPTVTLTAPPPAPTNIPLPTATSLPTNTTGPTNTPAPTSPPAPTETLNPAYNPVFVAMGKGVCTDISIFNSELNFRLKDPNGFKGLGKFREEVQDLEGQTVCMDGMVKKVSFGTKAAATWAYIDYKETSFFSAGTRYRSKFGNDFLSQLVNKKVRLHGIFHIGLSTVSVEFTDPGEIEIL